MKVYINDDGTWTVVCPKCDAELFTGGEEHECPEAIATEARWTP